MKRFELELMDWKQLEREAENQKRAAIMSMQIAEILYQEAIVHIKKLGGMTNREEDEANQARSEQGTKPTKAG